MLSSCCIVKSSLERGTSIFSKEKKAGACSNLSRDVVGFRGCRRMTMVVMVSEIVSE